MYYCCGEEYPCFSGIILVDTVEDAICDYTFADEPLLLACVTLSTTCDNVASGLKLRTLTIGMTTANQLWTRS